MSWFSGTFLDVALRDLGVDSFAICGIATGVGIEPTVRHGADLGHVPVVVEDACGARHAAAGRRSPESLRFAGEPEVRRRRLLYGRGDDRRALPARSGVAGGALKK